MSKQNQVVIVTPNINPLQFTCSSGFLYQSGRNQGIVSEFSIGYWG